PALRPDPGLLARVALGQFPSLPALRRGCLGLIVRHSSWLPLFGRFTGTMALSDSLRPCITVVSLRFTMRPLLRWARPDAGPPESRPRCFRACQGSATPPGACTPCQSGVPAVACRVFGARRHPDGPLRGSIPCLHLPLSTLHGPRYRGSRTTRGQRGWLPLHCRRLALLHTVPVCLGTPERFAIAALYPEIERTGQVNDDRAGRTLDALYDPRAVIWGDLIANAAQHYALDLPRLHADTMAMTFAGLFAEQPAMEGAPRLEPGYN